MPINNTNIKSDDVEIEQSLKSLVSAAAVVEVMAKVTPDVNHLLESNMVKISESFTKIAESARKLQEDIGVTEASSFAAKKPDFKDAVDDINKNIMEVIVGMQFQDRLSQNLVILKDISEETRSNISANLSSLPKQVDKESLKSLLALIKLGEVRDVFIEYLTKNGFISGPEYLDYNTVDKSSSENDEIELF